MYLTPRTAKDICSQCYLCTVHIGYSDNAGGIDFWAKLSLYPINYVWVSCRRGFIPRDNNITILYILYLEYMLHLCMRYQYLILYGVSKKSLIRAF